MRVPGRKSCAQSTRNSLSSDGLSAIINSIDKGILSVDSSGKIVFINPTAEKLLGISVKEFLGRHILEFNADSLIPQVLDSRSQLLGQHIEVNNNVFLCDYYPIVIEEKLSGAVAIFQDTTTLEKVSLELKFVRELLKEMEAIFQSSYDGIFITDGEGLVLKANKAYERIAGISAEEVVGKTMSALVEERYYDESVTLLVMEKHQPQTIVQTVKSGRKVLVTGNPIFDEDGNLFRVVTNVRDITELMALRDGLTTSREQALKYEAELTRLRTMQIEEIGLIYRSKTMSKAVETALEVANVDSTVLITGDSGTGKELLAKLIHQKGKGIKKPFIKINCGALPDSLMESELFGYEKGAFTGAKKEGKPGFFELANEGTLFLDEIGDMPLYLQVKLLRAIQDKEIVRVGGTTPISLNVRIIAATHRNLMQMVHEKSFRLDLYYRLMVVPIQIPSLQERKEDIPLLIKHFLDRFNIQFAFNKSFSPAVIERCVNYSWPGNVRELENVIERMMVTSAEDLIDVDHLPESIGKTAFLPARGTKLKEAVEQAEKFLMQETYREHLSWEKVAEVLGINRATVYRKAKKYHLYTGESQ